MGNVWESIRRMEKQITDLKFQLYDIRQEHKEEHEEILKVIFSMSKQRAEKA